MSFREKMAWISVGSMLVIFGVYFWSVVQRGPHGGVQFGALLASVIALVIVQVALIVVVAIFAPGEAQAPRDERDRLIALRATRMAYAGLATGVVCASFLSGFSPAFVYNANGLLFILLTAEILRGASEIVQYRLGA
jgi:uncharacterized membrane protein